MQVSELTSHGGIPFYKSGMANRFFHPLITLLRWCLMRQAPLVVVHFLSVLGGSKYSGHSLGGQLTLQQRNCCR